MLTLSNESKELEVDAKLEQEKLRDRKLFIINSLTKWMQTKTFPFESAGMIPAYPICCLLGFHHQPKTIMKKQLIQPLLGASAFAAMLFAAAPQASAITYNFSDVWSGATPSSLVTPWVTLDVNQIDANNVSLLLTAVNLTNTEFISLFEYNIQGGQGAVTPTNIINGSVLNLTQGANGFGFGSSFVDASLSFNSDVNFPPPGDTRFTNGSSFGWTLSRSTGINVDNIISPMLVHIQSIGTNGALSSKVVGSLPPPPPDVPDGGTTLLLLGTAVTSLGLLRRKFGVKIG